MLESTERRGAMGQAIKSDSDSMTTPPMPRGKRGAASVLSASPQGVSVPRKNTTDGVDPLSEAAGISWEKRSASISDGSGKAVFKQDDIEIPTFWSQTATNIVANKYFRGTIDTPSASLRFASSSCA